LGYGDERLNATWSNTRLGLILGRQRNEPAGRVAQCQTKRNPPRIA
jgi:hypothetical protein